LSTRSSKECLKPSAHIPIESRDLGLVKLSLSGKSFKCYTDKNKIYKEIQMGAVAKSYRRKGFQIYDKMCKYLVIYEDAVCHK
jgi:hypothetical protein